LFSKLRAPIQAINSTRPQDTTDNKGADSQNEGSDSIPAKPNPPPTPTNKPKSCQRYRKWLPIATLIVEVLALLGLWTYAGLTYKMWRETQKQTRLNFGAEVFISEAALYQLRPKPKSMVAITFGTRPGPARNTTEPIVPNIEVSATIDFLPLRSVPHGIPSDAAIKDVVMTSRLECLHPNRLVPGEPVCVQEIHRELSMNGYDDYIQGRKALYVWGAGTFIDTVGSGDYSFCRYITVDKSGKTVDAIVNGVPDWRMAVGGTKWQDCQH
jgi:hypothetical protein